MPTQTTIPTGWELVSLGKIVEVLPSSVDKHIREGEKIVFLCNYMDVYYKNKITSSDGLASGTVKASEYEKFKLCKGDVLITKDSETPEDIARSCVVTKDFDDIVCGYHVAMLKGKKTKINGFFLKRIFDVPTIQYYFFSLSNGVTRFGITKPSIESAEILLPPLPEQEKIVEVLESWDSYLEKLTDTIKCKKAIKKGLMSKLLYGKIRVTGFSKKWEKRKLADFLFLYDKKTKIENHAPVLTSSRKELLRQDDYYVNGRISDRSNIGFNVLPEGYLTYRSRSDDGYFRFNINNLGYTGVISKYYPVFKVINACPEFVLTLLNFRRGVYAKYCIGTSQLVLSFNALKKITFLMPEIEEQTAIAQILTATDQEIEVLEKKKSIIEQQKKFLLNNLITGRIRLPEFIK